MFPLKPNPSIHLQAGLVEALRQRGAFRNQKSHQNAKGWSDFLIPRSPLQGEPLPIVNGVIVCGWRLGLGPQSNLGDFPCAWQMSGSDELFHLIGPLETSEKQQRALGWKPWFRKGTVSPIERGSEPGSETATFDVPTGQTQSSSPRYKDAPL